ncbi:MAG: hypothetical protein M1831_007190, partial [Alyxoria varia]
LKQRDHDLNDVQLQVLSLPSAVGLGDRKRLVNGSTTTILSDMGSEMTVTMRNIVLNCGKGVTHVETWSQVASELKGAFKELEESLASLRQEKAEVISDLTSVVELLDTKLQELQASQDEIQSLYKNGKEHRQWFLTEQHTRKGYKDIIDRLLPHAGINVEEFWMNTGRQRSENEDGEEHVEH